MCVLRCPGQRTKEGILISWVRKVHVMETGRPIKTAMAICLAGFMIRLDIYIANISLPAMCRYFNVGTGQVSYVMLSYLLMVTSSMLLFGKLGDRFGMKRILVVGYGVFSLGSLLSGLSVTLSMLILARGLQGLGGAMLFTSAFSSISRVLPKEDTGWGYGMWSTFVGLGITAGAPLGGMISGFFSWHWIFLVNVPIGLLGLLLAQRFIPADRPARVKGEPFDFSGTILSFLCLLALVYALNQAGVRGWGSPKVLISFGASALLLTWMLRGEKRHPNPLLPPDLFKNRGYTYAVLTGIMGFMFVAGNSFLMPFYLIMTHGLSPQAAGLMMVLYALAFAMVSPRAGRLSDTVDPRKLGLMAMAALTVASVSFAYVLRLPTLLPAALFLLWMGLALGFFFSPNNRLAMGTAPSRQRGVAAGVYQASVNMGMVLGVSLFETVFSRRIDQTNGLPALGFDHVDGTLPPHFDGYRDAYLLAAFFCVLAMLIFYASKRSQQRLNK